MASYPPPQSGPSMPGQSFPQQPTAYSGYPPQQPNYSGYPPQQQYQQPAAYGYPPQKSEDSPYNSEFDNKKPAPDSHAQSANVPRPPNPDGRFPPPSGYQDVWAAALYAIYSLVVLAVSVWLGTKIKFMKSSNSVSSPNENEFETGHFVAFGVSVLATIVLAYLYVRLVQAFPQQYIKGSIFFAAASVIAGSVVLAVKTKAYLLLAIGVVLAIVFAIIWYFIRKRIAFAAVLLERSANVIKKYPATIAASLFGAICKTVYGVIIVVGIAGAAVSFKSEPVDGRNAKNQNAGAYALYIFYLFHSIWTSQIVMNTIHVTVAGLFATHYFQHGTQGGMPTNPTARAAKRALTVSFGSICYGSLLVAIIQFLRQLLKNSRDNESGIGTFIVCILDCLLSCVQGVLEFINTYAFIQVAIYGKPFCVAAKDTWTLIKDRGFEVIIAKDILGLALGIGAFIGGILTAGVAAIVLVAFDLLKEDNNIWIFVLVVSFLIGILAFFFVTVPLQTGAQTLMVCIAEDPSIIYSTDRAFWDKIRETYPDAALQGIA